MTVYLLHLDQPIPRGVSRTGKPLTAQHYLGVADDVDKRLDEHRHTTWTPLDEPEPTETGGTRRGQVHGNGSALIAFANFLGIPWQLARTWDSDHSVERRLKNRHEAPRLCPICNPAKGKTS